MKPNRLFALGAALALASLLPAQDCGATLAVNGSGALGSDLQLKVSNAPPNTLAILGISEIVTRTVIWIDLNICVDVGIGIPWMAAPIGVTGSNGQLHYKVSIPNAPLPHHYYAQVLLQNLVPTPVPGVWKFCATNVAQIEIK